jgi:protein ImuB
MRPDHLGRPIAVFDPTKRPRPLLEPPDEGAGHGDVGMALREAESRWPDVAYRAADPATYAQALEPVLMLLAELSPTVEWSAEPAEASAAARHEPTARYAIFLDGTGLAPLFGSEERLARLIVGDVQERTGHQASVGIADGRFAALRAATRPRTPMPDLHPTRPLAGPWGSRGPMVGRIVPPGGDAAFLARLPVALLPLPPDICDRIASLGARTLAEFGALPSNALRHRFGQDGVVARALALGRDEGPLRARPTPLQLHDTINLEWVETSLDRLLFLLKRLADRLSVRLGHHGLGCGRLRVCWLLDDSGLTTGDDLEDPLTPRPPLPATGEGEHGMIVSTVRLAEPAGGGASLLEHLRWHVEGLRPETFRDPETGQMRGVRGIMVEAEELAPLAGRQLALLPGEDGRASQSERLLAAERTLARLQARWGETAVQQAELVASRRPERAFRWRETGWAFQLPGAVPGTSGSTSRLTRTPRPSVRRGKTLTPTPSPGARERGARLQPGHVLPSPSQWGGVGGGASPVLGGGTLWLKGQPEEVEVDRGGQLPNGRRRAGTVTQQGRRPRRIVQAAGPWRLVERWAAEPVARDAYHVVLSDGSACWLVHDRLGDQDERWYLFGTFD